MQQVASQNAPSPNIVISHFVAGGMVWLMITALITLFPEALTKHYFNPKLLAIAHLLVLGWISMIIFGALYQLIPVIMEVKLYSEKLAVSTFILLLTGAIMLAVSFWNFWLGTFMHLSAILILAAITIFAYNIFLTAKHATKKSIENDFIQTSVIWLLFTVVVGIALAINLRYPFIPVSHLELLKLHAHAGIVGWFIQLIIGVGSKLIPMFMVAHNLNSTKLSICFYLINLGLVSGIMALYFSWNVGVGIAIVTVILGLSFFLSFLLEAYKKRVKKHLDIGMKKSVLAFIVLAFAIVVILSISVNIEKIKSFSIPMATAYGSILLVGFISALIMGQTYKTLPFIVWLKVYRKKVGKIKIPFPKELYSEKVALAQFWLFISGLTILVCGIVLQNNTTVSIGGTALFLSVILYNFNILKIIFHKPKIND
ncbi:MAG: hypothetical protein ACLGGV_06850 [Bacteroidia bacterium]